MTSGLGGVASGPEQVRSRRRPGPRWTCSLVTPTPKDGSLPRLDAPISIVLEMLVRLPLHSQLIFSDVGVGAVLRGVAEGRVAWAFWPPDMEVSLDSKESSDGMGIWIPRPEDDAAGSDEESEEEEDDEVADNKEETPEVSENDDSGTESESDSAALHVGAGRFGALQDIDDVETSDAEVDAS
jgi:hypothetical protein